VTRQSLTAPGMVAGTLAYMAPEQLKGRPADERSDIWALGIVLHEMATGTRPFQGQTGFELTAAILNQPVPEVPASVPAPLANVVARCLAKEPGERCQPSSEVRAALEAVASGQAVARMPGPATAPGPRAAEMPRRRWMGRAAAGVLGLAVIAAGVLFGLDVGGVRSRVLGRGNVIKRAVLPLANLSGDAGQEYLSDGLTQELIAQLGRLHPETLSVIARTSVVRYKKTDKPVDQIGRELGVDYILEGSAKRQGDRVRIAAELIKVTNQTQVWADTFDRELSAILQVQGQVAQSVAKALAVRLLPAEEARLAVARTVNPEAYDASLRGSTLWQSLTAADLDAAQRDFELALGKDPSYAPSHAGLACVWLVRGQGSVTGTAETSSRAKAAAQQAIALDDSSAEAHEALASVLTWSDWDWAGAGREWARALELNPNGANAHAYYAHYLAIMGRAAEGVAHSERAIELDPFNALYHGLHGVVLVYLRRWDEALAAGHAGLPFGQMRRSRHPSFSTST